MPVVNTNTIKEWFRTLKKPTEDQFWAWLDSFRHKWEKVPMNDVDGLPKALRDKADLVNGIVPEEQLPFSIKTSEVLAIGAISASENSVSVGLHASGKNRVRLAGVIYERSFANNFLFTAVVNYYKILIVYALPEPGLFFLAEGAEALEAIEPELPEGAFVIRRIVVSTTGQIIEPETATGLKYAEEDGWRNINLTEVLTILPYSYDLRSSYYITGSVEGATIGGLRNALIDRNASPSWDGKEFWIYNATGGDLPLDSASVTDDDVFLFARSITLKADQSCKVKLRRDALEIVGVMSGGADFPAGGNPGDVLQWDEDGAAWTDRLTNQEAVTEMLFDELSEEIADRTAAVNALDGKITTEKNERIAADALKVDKPTTDGTWSLQKLGSVFTWVSGVVQNIANTDLSNLSARIFTQGNTFTWNTAGFFHYLKGLLDKTGQAAYTKVVVVHPTTGETVTRDFADPAATTLAVQNANSTQKTAMRTALLGTATPANPVLQDTNVRFVKRGVNLIDLYGINLTLLDPTFIWIEKLDGTKIYSTNFYNLTSTAVTTQWDFPIDLPNADYEIKIQNGVTVQGLSNAKITIVDSISNITLLSADWKMRLRMKPDLTEATLNPNDSFMGVSDNFVKLAGVGVVGYDSSLSFTWPAVAYKSQNVFPGNKDFDIAIDTNFIYGAGARLLPYIGLTETTHADFLSINGMVINATTYEGLGIIRLSEASPSYPANGTIGTLYISKRGGKVFYRMYNKVSLINFSYFTQDIDTTKTYALFIRDGSQTGGAWSQRQHTITARIMN